MAVLFTIPVIFLGILLIHIALSHFNKLRGAARRKPPPGPWGLPIIGSLHLLGTSPHRNLTELAKKYGPIMFMRLGSVPTVVVSSPAAAKLFLRTHDLVFANRPKHQAFKHLTYETKSIAFNQYGSYWRNVRKLCTVELLSAAKISSFASVRKEEVGMLVQSLKEMAAAGQVVDITKRVTEVVENITYRMLFGGTVDGITNLKNLVGEATELAGTFNLADYLPFLAPLDLQGLVPRFKAIKKAVDEILEKIINQHIQDGPNNHNPTNFMDIMLDSSDYFTNPRNDFSYTDRTNVKAIAIDMLVGAIGSSSATIEWVFSELLRHPKVMKKLQDEIQNVVTMNHMVDEKDVDKFSYLDMVLKEVFRLHPIGPFLVPHESTEDITIEGYFIPKRSTLLINTWAIGRDVDIWSDNVEEFLPERFKNRDINLYGHDFELLPFGSGRRGCPGIQLSLVTIGLVLAQLLHCFNWELPNGMSPDDLDMDGKLGLTLTRVNHLCAIPTYRLSV